MRFFSCHVEPFGFAQDKLRRENWLQKMSGLYSQPDSSASVGMTNWQKRRCETKWLDSDRIKLMLVVLVTAVALGGGLSANADFTFGTPTNLGPTVNSLAFEGSPDISNDGLSLFFDAYFRADGPGDWDIWVTTRDVTNGDWGAAVPLPPPINSPYADAGPTISADGLSLFFASDRPGGYGGFDLWVTTRKTIEDPWEPPVNLGPIVNSLAVENHPSISADGLSLYFDSNWYFWFDYDICVVTRASINHDWGIPVWLGPATDWGLYDWSPSISSDGLTLFFECRSQLGDRELLVARRRTTDEDWDNSVNLGPSVNTIYDDCDPSIAVDGCALYFCSGRPGGIGNRDLWQVAIEPVVDFNGDGIVDSADMCIMVDNWGTDEPLCDIGPTPFGDGIVDVQDLTVLAEHLFEEIFPIELVAYWKLDETEGIIAYESIGDNDGTLNGNPVWQPTDGQVAGALQFNGIDDYVSTDFVLNPADGSFSAFAWINGGAPGQVVISQKINTGGVNWLSVDPLAQLSQLSIEIGTFDSARAVSFHHKAGRLADGCIPWAVVASAISP